MMVKSTILIADSQQKNRQLFKSILKSEYELLAADNEEKILELMHWYERQLAAVILDFTDTVHMDGYHVLKEWQEDNVISRIPVIAVCGAQDYRGEAACFLKGVWDVIHMPFEPEVLRARVRNVTARSELQTLEHIQYIHKYDELTGIYNKNRFLHRTEEILCRCLKERFAFVHMDIYQFHLVNQFYGISEADRLLQYIASLIADIAGDSDRFTYGRYRADVFCFCMPFEDEASFIKLMEKLREDINKFHIEHDLVPVFGIYIIDDHRENIITISDRANLAAKKCKGSYIKNYSFYDASMSEKLVKEQKIINTMKKALSNEQFVLYIQPKYDLHTDRINGGEVLVRWMIPDKGIVPPGEFIPVFERNGFIAKLDYYVWEHTCKIIREWLDKGRKPFPVSVNISRVSLYNPKLADLIYNLVKQYGIEPRLMQLELTESAYASNPDVIRATMARLQEYGFCILMDDFGSGYSSLNTLKDIAVDIIKLDMNFFKDSDRPGRGENILASVVRMAKWLEIPVIAEGVEKESQAVFLRSIGCEYVQGYYFAKPMPVDEYEQLAFESAGLKKEKEDGGRHDTDKLWDSSSQMELLFSNMLQAVAIFEYTPDTGAVDTIRVNNAYFDLFGYSDLNRMGSCMSGIMDAGNREAVSAAFKRAAVSKNVARCEFCCTNGLGREQWIEMKLKYMREIGGRSVIFATLINITDQKEIERELYKYRKVILSSESKVETILIVDDIAMSRKLLRNMFESRYHILEASNGAQALEIVRKNRHIDLILLDVIMPVLDGRGFLKQKQKDASISQIPVVIITTEDSPQQQIHALSMGANDYVVKPFIPEVVIKRVCNVLESQKKASRLLKKAGSSAQEQSRYLAGLVNRNESGQTVRAMQQSAGLQALLLISIHNLQQVYESAECIEADKIVLEFAGRIRSCFTKSDILARYRRNEFIIFVADAPSRETVEKKCDELVCAVRELETAENMLEYSVGAVLTEKSEDSRHHSLMELLGYADEALEQAKRMGRNQWYLYERK